MCARPLPLMLVLVESHQRMPTLNFSDQTLAECLMDFRVLPHSIESRVQWNGVLPVFRRIEISEHHLPGYPQQYQPEIHLKHPQLKA